MSQRCKISAAHLDRMDVEYLAYGKKTQKSRKGCVRWGVGGENGGGRKAIKDGGRWVGYGK